MKFESIKSEKFAKFEAKKLGNLVAVKSKYFGGTGSDDCDVPSDDHTGCTDVKDHCTATDDDPCGSSDPCPDTEMAVLGG